ncbi:glycerophosphodiester phosphodiesterase family protein [Pelagibacterium halotolerans]|uniref:Glycerophosphoryl diester phosphodiesterase n=1 Tax=Pelagibacterium halotolerans (strain DSM 22347 / JCM 15775 / CGMCC 1.7692 / B2) TaxID=1082931 RepID=G4RBY4_PELHB|nr:glycerophosphodiester phosphodiesterase family protein [Pelagibacterium halotolerans]AEQ51632.1 glycerophosphoryl diester phosphodiesterase [Pelagibacterium halotolerans B2]QJR18539.1 glycerophosphodiester phosphodiesterase [Pelagibacterium halotolerans]SEA18674.1 Glycerophosphoryl diester phosphodiesterase [Pelagibacterium halotolerans]
MTEFPFNRPIAHRGLHDRANGIIENSRSAFEAAIERGFAIECDVQLTQDGEAVVFHDNELQRLTGQDGLVSEMTAEALCVMPLTGSASGDTPIRFSDFLAGIAGQVGLVVEIKQQDYPAQTRMLAEKILSDIAGYEGAIAFKSFDPLALNVLHKKGYRGPLGIITYDYKSHADHLNGTQKFVLRNTLHRAVSHFTFISCERTALTAPMIRLRRAFGIKVMSWTVRSKDQANAALRHADQIVFEGFDPEA